MSRLLTKEGSPAIEVSVTLDQIIIVDEYHGVYTSDFEHTHESYSFAESFDLWVVRDKNARRHGRKIKPMKPEEIDVLDAIFEGRT